MNHDECECIRFLAQELHHLRKRDEIDLCRLHALTVQSDNLAEAAKGLAVLAQIVPQPQ